MQRCKKIRLGPDSEDTINLYAALRNAGCNISHMAEDILDGPNFVTSMRITEVEPVIVYGTELGFVGNVECRSIYQKALTINGLDLCPAEVGPQFLLQHGNLLSKGEELIIGMNPLPDPENANDHYVFSVYRGQIFDELWLSIRHCEITGTWEANKRWMFLNH